MREIMFKNEIKIALTSLRKYKAYSFINIAGLAVGMACCLLILMYVQDELSYDRFHTNTDRIFRVTAEFGPKDKPRSLANTPYPVAPALKAEFPEIFDAVRFRIRYRPIIQYQDKRFWEENFCLVDSTFLEFFSFSMISGNPKTALAEPNSVVITEETARRYFGEEDPIGKTLFFNHDTPFVVTGVIENLPQNTHLAFDSIAPIKSLDGPWNRWTTFVRNYTYIVLPENYDPKALESKLPAFLEKYVGNELAAEGYTFKLHLQPLMDIHLHSHLGSEIKPNSHIAYIYLFSSIAGFILLLACINFINMTTARSSSRAKEVGIRKTLGAQRLQLVKQFLGESVFFSLVALFIALILIEILLPTFNTLTDKNLVFQNIIHVPWLLVLAAIAIFAGVVAGSYPAWILSAFQPGQVLLEKVRTGSPNSRDRKILVAFQFIVSIALIVCTTIVYEQMRYVRTKSLGFDKEQVVVISLGSQVGQRAERLKNRWQQNLNVISATASLLVPTTSLWTWGVKPQNAEKSIEVGTYMVDYDFIETYKMDIIAGRSYSQSFPSDEQDAFLINETAMRQFGWETPEAALDKRLDWAGERKGKVIGVVRDFNVSSLHNKIDPVVLFIKPEYQYISVRIRSEEVQATLAFLKQTWFDYFSHLPFEYFFLDDRFDHLHRADERLGQVFGYFSLLAIFVAGLGLFGLASFTAEQRTKEIGVRKVLGASVSNVVALLSKDFVKIVLIANILAWPLAYFAMNRWLENFAYRTDIEWWVFALAGGLALVIALLTVSTQAIKAALANPVESLRYE
jgi:putative ABC transport system permease protein